MFWVVSVVCIMPKRNEFWTENSWFLQQDNSPAHTALIIHDHCAKNSTHIFPQPPHSTDLAPSNFCLFLKLKRPETYSEILKKRWHKCGLRLFQVIRNNTNHNILTMIHTKSSKSNQEFGCSLTRSYSNNS